MTNQRLWNYDNPLQRCPEMGESRAANQGLRDYALMGARRSLRKLLEQYSNVPPTKKPPTRYFHTLATWSNKYDWVVRVNRHDELEQDRAIEQWRERQSEIRDQGWDIGQALLKRAEKMLTFPLSKSTTEREEVSPDGTVIHQHITIEPTTWTDGTIYSMAKVANEICRLSAKMETENVQVAVVNKFTADDLAAASNKARDWEREQYDDKEKNAEV
jgi:hypothetical protein